MFSKSCEYAIRASIYVARQSIKGRKVSQIEIAKSINSPEAFTAKIMQKLTGPKIIHSSKGPNGGFFLNLTELDSVKLWHIILAIDGDSLLEDCTLGLEKCNALKPCALHFSFVNIRAEIRRTLEETSLLALVEDVSEEDSILKR